MRTGLAIFFSLFLIIGCKNKNRPPHGIIPDNKMEMILWDMIRADEYFTTKGFLNDTSQEKKAEMINLYGQIFKIHKTTKDQFQKSLVFYRSRPVILKTMMDSLGARQKEISRAPQPLPKPVIDSLPFRKRTLRKPL